MLVDTNRSTIHSVFTTLSHKSRSLFQFTASNIKSIISKLDPNKVLVYNMISICVIKLCGDSIYKALEMILNLV